MTNAPHPLRTVLDELATMQLSIFEDQVSFKLVDRMAQSARKMLGERTDLEYRGQRLTPELINHMLLAAKVELLRRDLMKLRDGSFDSLRAIELHVKRIRPLVKQVLGCTIDNQAITEKYFEDLITQAIAKTLLSSLDWLVKNPQLFFEPREVQPYADGLHTMLRQLLKRGGTARYNGELVTAKLIKNVAQDAIVKIMR